MWRKKRNYTGFMFRFDQTPTATAQKAQQFPKPTLMYLMMAEAGQNMQFSDEDIKNLTFKM
jgi:hypothetical protein